MRAQAYLKFVQTSLRELDDILGGDVEAALTDRTKALAVERILQTVSDATKHFPEDIKDRYPEVEWKNIVGFRNWIVHGYLGIDPDVVRGVLQSDIHKLKQAVEDYLSTHG